MTIATTPLTRTYPARSMWKGVLSALALVAIAMVRPAQAGEIVNDKNVSLPQQGSNMTHVSFGENSKLTALPSERERIRAFYHDLLGCSITRKSDLADFFKIGDTFYLGVVYDDAAQSEQDRMKSIWLELRTDHPAELKQKILKFGIPEIQYWDKEHFYFQAPGGQVFRLASTTEDMSKWQK